MINPLDSRLERPFPPFFLHKLDLRYIKKKKKKQVCMTAIKYLDFFKKIYLLEYFLYFPPILAYFYKHERNCNTKILNKFKLKQTLYKSMDELFSLG